jgi:2-polyprenyl-3-methyl-5-hydroxy-6-metoxy-1,4-benzoquinol methylase
MKTTYLDNLLMIGDSLNQADIPYHFTDEAALFIQGVEISRHVRITVTVQWDVFDAARTLFAPFSPTEMEREPEKASFLFYNDGLEIIVTCVFNTTVKTDPYRIAIQIGKTKLWCRSLYSYLFDPQVSNYANDIHEYLEKEQRGFTEQNEHAWNQNNYLALVNRYGQPNEIAAKITQNPKWRLHPFYKYMGDIAGKKVVHLMGSNGVKATALAILGAEVTVIDFSKENAAFANELAAEAEVKINYIISDVLSLSSEHLTGSYDVVLMELGVLHYLIDLQPLMTIIKRLLKKGGRFILHEFHPISTKLITSSGKKHKITGNYFDPVIENHTVAFSKHMPEQEQESLTQTVQRKWTIGELITSVGQSGLIIRVLEEEPNHKLHDIGLPKTYTLVAEKQ